MPIELRKTMLHVETTFVEGGRTADVPLRLFAALAVLRNPWAGRGFVEDLKPEIHEIAPMLGQVLTEMIIDAVGSGDAVEAYGKAAVVGLDGEIVVALGASVGGRPHHRIGDRYQDLKDLGHDVDNPAAV